MTKQQISAPLHPEYIKAFKLIFAWGSGGNSRVAMARWLLDFSYRKPKQFSQKDQWEALVFAYRGGLRKFKDCPTKSDLMKIQNWLLSAWAELGKGEDHFVDFVFEDCRAMLLRAAGGLIHGQILKCHLSWSNAFKREVYDSFTVPAMQNRLRFCLNERCKHAFIPNKRQAYCSSSCSQNLRTRLWRKKNHDKFLAARRAAYKRNLEVALGRPVKITFRSKQRQVEVGTP